MDRLYREYKQQVEFLLVYVREAHPSDGWQVQSNRREGVEYKKPTTLKARAEIAGDCVKSLDISFPCLLDDMDDQVDKVYGGWPSRAVIVGTDGKIVYLSPSGPRGIVPEAIRREVLKLVPKADEQESGNKKEAE